MTSNDSAGNSRLVASPTSNCTCYRLQQTILDNGSWLRRHPCTSAASWRTPDRSWVSSHNQQRRYQQQQWYRARWFLRKRSKMKIFRCWSCYWSLSIFCTFASIVVDSIAWFKTLILYQLICVNIFFRKGRASFTLQEVAGLYVLASLE